jgi:hypothetical protein
MWSDVASGEISHSHARWSTRRRQCPPPGPCRSLDFNNGALGQFMADGIFAGVLLTIFAFWTSAFEHVTAVGLNLIKRRHGESGF